jgi:hypothetical protein
MGTTQTYRVSLESGRFIREDWARLVTTGGQKAVLSYSEDSGFNTMPVGCLFSICCFVFFFRLRANTGTLHQITP